TEYPLWETEFFQPASKLLSRLPIYPCLGNHERNSPHYFDLFVLPGNERFYTFAWSYASFFILDIYFSPCDANSEQYQWLQTQLANARTPWKFVVLHSPIYTSGPHGRLNEQGKPRESQIRLGQELLEPLFRKYGITAVFSGHDHLYERSFKDGIYYIVTGGGGAPLYHPTGDPKQNPYSQKVVSVYHYCLITVMRDTVHVQAKDINGQVIDEFTIARRR
ncbi:MAG TPA: hypothetical protein EYP10_11295, partial [Armatimonadetes bacterium]|nr:hypothetical protein [Armatimonadota bacterium]